jgi:hypothetical protein
MARPAGIEPATAGLEGRCSIRLSYGRFTNQQVTAPIVLFSGRRSGPKQTESEVRADYIAVCRHLKRLMVLTGGADRLLEGIAFHGELEFRQCVLPLSADEFQRAAGLVQLRRLKLPQPFSPDLHIAHQPGSRQHAQMLGDGLPGNVRSGSQLRDGHGAAHAQGRDEPKSHLIAQRRKNGCVNLQRPGS